MVRIMANAWALAAPNVINMDVRAAESAVTVCLRRVGTAVPQESRIPDPNRRARVYGDVVTPVALESATLLGRESVRPQDLNLSYTGALLCIDRR